MQIFQPATFPLPYSKKSQARNKALTLPSLESLGLAPDRPRAISSEAVAELRQIQKPRVCSASLEAYEAISSLNLGEHSVATPVYPPQCEA